MKRAHATGPSEGHETTQVTPGHYEAMATEIRVRDIQVPLSAALSLAPSMIARDGVADLERANFDYAPVLTDHELAGLVALQDLKAAPGRPVSESMQPVTAKHLVSAHSAIASLMSWLLPRPFLFVLDGHEVAGFVTSADLNRQPGRTYFYILVAGLEAGLAELIRDRIGDDERAVAALGEGRGSKIRTVWEEARRADSDAGPVAKMNFSDLLTVVARESELRRALGFESRRSWEDVTGPLVGLRNAVMHPSRDDLVGAERTLQRLLALDERLRALNDVIDRLTPSGRPYRRSGMSTTW